MTMERRAARRADELGDATRDGARVRRAVCQGIYAALLLGIVTLVGPPSASTSALPPAGQIIIDCNSNGVPDADDVRTQFFEPSHVIDVGESPTEPVLADFDGDDDLDLALSNFAGRPELALYRYTVNGYVPAGTLRTQTSPPTAVAADFDGDRDADIVAIDPGATRLFVFKNNGSGVFETSSSPVADVGDLRATDLDMDGDIDLAVTFPSSTKVVLYRNDGEARFTSAPGFDGLAGLIDLAFADLDDDGDPDALVTDRERNVLLQFENDGAGVFGPPAEYPTGYGPTQIRVADIDGDDDLDVVLGHADHTANRGRRRCRCGRRNRFGRHGL
jgi:hypothetical protein